MARWSERFASMGTLWRAGLPRAMRPAPAVNPASPEVAARFFRSELTKYARLVKKADVELQ